MISCEISYLPAWAPCLASSRFGAFAHDSCPLRFQVGILSLLRCPIISLPELKEVVVTLNSPNQLFRENFSIHGSGISKDYSQEPWLVFLVPLTLRDACILLVARQDKDVFCACGCLMQFFCPRTLIGFDFWGTSHLRNSGDPLKWAILRNWYVKLNSRLEEVLLSELVILVTPQLVSRMRKLSWPLTW